MMNVSNKIKIRPPCPRCSLFENRIIYEKDGSFKGIMDCPIYKEDYSCFDIVTK